MIEGKLVEMGREPRHVQVVISEAEHRAERLALRGIFLEADQDFESVTPEGENEGGDEPVVTVEAHCVWGVCAECGRII